MTLSSDDSAAFFRIICNLDTFFESRLHQLRDTSPNEIQRLRNTAFADPAHVEAYITANPDKLPASDLDEVRAWQQHTFTGRFLIHQEKKDGCLFEFTGENSPMNVYLVKGLTNPISEIVPFLPCYVETRLLPFRGHIVTDGILSSTMMRFSARMAKSMLTQARETIATHGLITTLPAAARSDGSDSDLLKFYLSTSANRRDYFSEIIELSGRSRELRLQYYQRMGHLSRKTLRTGLIRNGITAGHFAILEDTIIAGAANKSQAEACAASLVPPDLLPALVWLKVSL